ncbi:MAG: acetyltransferase [Rhodococcus sp. (in: high G+C Gram-positive bacteria)]|uniref:acetyltransferase n=1 Tax=Rhodococcus sp. TaxID=1831 RepID=UPI003BB7FA52
MPAPTDPQAALVPAAAEYLDTLENPRVELRAGAGEPDFGRLVEVWRSAVRATHHFLSSQDIAFYEDRMAREYLPAVDVTVAVVDGRIVGFSGLAEGRLEMLFVDDDHRGTGVGSVLLADALHRYPALTLDVNEQNPTALAFYQRRGFVVTGRSDLDGDGRPFPLLHLAVATGLYGVDQVRH